MLDKVTENSEKNNNIFKGKIPDTPDLSYDFDGIIDGFVNSLLERIVSFLFRKIDFDNMSLRILREYADKNNIIYVSFHSSNISLLLLCHLLRRYNINIPIAALEENPYLMQSAGHIWKRVSRFFQKTFLGRQFPHIFETDYIERKLEDKRSILISLLSRKFFLRRYTEIKYDSLIYLVNLQKNLDDPVYLLPQMIFWNQNPERTKPRLSSQATGDKGFISGWITMLKSATPAFVKILSPVNLREVIENSKVKDTEQISIDLRNKFLEMYHHEKRAVLGPVIRSRQEMMEKVLYHSDVLDMINKQAGRENAPEKRLRRKAYMFFREIAANYTILLIQMFKTPIAFIFNKIFDGIDYDADALRKIVEASKKGPLILAPSHKSSMDYFIMSYIFYLNKLFLPHIAAGKNLAFFPAGPILRRAGAFFIRRSFRGQKLYATVFKQYVRTLVSEGYSIEVFTEGGRTRTGKLLLPKLGFLYYLIEAVYAGYNNDLVFAPIAIDYDRILEEKNYVKELKGSKKENESIAGVIKSKKLFKRKYGRLYISFSEPFTLKEIAAGTQDIKKLPDIVANRITNKINEVTVVTPFALVTTAILNRTTKGFSKSALKEKCVKLYAYLNHCSARLSATLAGSPDIEDIIRHVTGAYIDDKILHEIVIESGNTRDTVDDLLSLHEDDRSRICFYKNSIVHYFLPVSFTSLALLYLYTKKNNSLKESEVREEYDFIKDIFRREFLFTDDDSCDTMNDTASRFCTDNTLFAREEDKITINNDKKDDVRFFSSLLRDHFESYLIVLKSILKSGDKQVKKEELINNIRKDALIMYHLGDIKLPEAISVPQFNNAVTRFIDMCILKGNSRDTIDADIHLADAKKAESIFDRIQSYLKIMD